jgi:hypothetical protein
MSIETIVAIIQALIGFAGQVPELIIAGETAIGLLRSGSAPTIEQQAQIDSALEAANTALQAS